MTTIQTALRPARFRRTSAVVAAAGVLIAVGIALLFLTLAGSTRTTAHAAIRHPAPAPYHGAYYPLIQYPGTGAAPATTSGARPTTPALSSPRTSYGATP